MNSSPDLGTPAWVIRTGGRLTRADRRALLGPLARSHAANAVGRIAMAARLSPGFRRTIDPAALTPPRSALTVVG